MTDEASRYTKVGRKFAEHGLSITRVETGDALTTRLA